MAEIIVDNNESNLFFAPYSIWRIGLVGLSMGFLFWGLTSIIGLITNSVDLAGGITTVIVATFSILLMVRLKMAQPLIIAAGSALALWGLAGWTNGLAVYEIILWSIVLYGIAYVLFSWITKINQVVPVLLLIALAIIFVRMVISL